MFKILCECFISLAISRRGKTHGSGDVHCCRVLGFYRQLSQNCCCIFNAHVSHLGVGRPVRNRNLLYTGGLFHCYILNESICHFRVVGSILALLFYFCWKSLLANVVDPDQTPHHLATDFGLHCLPMTLLRVSGKKKKD